MTTLETVRLMPRITDSYQTCDGYYAGTERGYWCPDIGVHMVNERTAGAFLTSCRNVEACGCGCASGKEVFSTTPGRAAFDDNGRREPGADPNNLPEWRCPECGHECDGDDLARYDDDSVDWVACPKNCGFWLV